MKFCHSMIVELPFLNNPRDLDLSYRTDLVFEDCLRRNKTLSYIRKNTITIVQIHEHVCQDNVDWKNCQ